MERSRVAVIAISLIILLVGLWLWLRSREEEEEDITPPPPPPPNLANIYGKVTFRKTGAPLSEVKVSVGSRTTYTDASGGYLIENVAPGTYHMTLEKEGYETLRDTVTLVAGNNKEDAEMTLVPALMASLSGRVTDADTGAAIAGAEIIVVEKTGFMEANVYKTTSGTLSLYSLENMVFENSPIVVDISVLAAGYEMIKLVNVGLNEGANVKNFSMAMPPPKFGSFSGKVVDSPTGAPLTGVLVSMDGLTAYTDSDGLYKFTNIQAKRYTVTLSKEGYEPVTFEYTLTEGDHKYPTIKMRRTEAYAASLYGYIIDSETGEGVYGAGITVYQDVSAMTTKTFRATTNKSGYFVLTGMVPGVPGKYVVYAGGYKTVTGKVSIVEGSNELNITMTWSGGDRNVPRYISHQVPAQITSGKEFTAKLTVFLPYQAERFRNYLRIVSQDARGKTEIAWSLLPASIYDRCNEATQAKYIRFDQEGSQYLEGTGIAGYKKYRDKELTPLPPGTYNVEAYLKRNHVTVNSKGGLTAYSSDHPATWFWGPVIVGTVEVIHASGFASLTGIITHKDTGERLQNVTVTISGPVSDVVHTNSESEYEFINLPVGDYTIKLKDLRSVPWPGGYYYATYNISLQQGWNTKDMVV